MGFLCDMRRSKVGSLCKLRREISLNEEVVDTKKKKKLNVTYAKL